MLMCYVYAFSLRRESLDMILRDEPRISDVVLSHSPLAKPFALGALSSTSTALVVVTRPLSGL
jgi:hypothetical protein